MFFEATNGRSYPVSRIVAIHREKDNKVTVELEGRLTVETWPVELDKLNRHARSTFPAQPDTFIVRIDEGGEVFKTLVIGWCVATDGATYPVTTDGVNDDMDDQLLWVLTPDGKVSQRGVTTWDNLEAWEAATRAGPAAEF